MSGTDTTHAKRFVVVQHAPAPAIETMDDVLSKENNLHVVIFGGIVLGSVITATVFLVLNMTTLAMLFGLAAGLIIWFEFEFGEAVDELFNRHARKKNFEKKVQQQQAHLHQVLVKNFIQWLNRHNIVVDESKAGRIIRNMNNTGHTMFSDEKNRMLTLTDENGTWLLTESKTKRKTSTLSKPASDEPDHLHKFAEKMKTIQNRVNVLSSQQLNVEHAHALSRVEEDLQSVTLHARKLAEVDRISKQDELQINNILEKLQEELKVLTFQRSEEERKNIAVLSSYITDRNTSVTMRIR